MKDKSQSVSFTDLHFPPSKVSLDLTELYAVIVCMCPISIISGRREYFFSFSESRVLWWSLEVDNAQFAQHCHIQVDAGGSLWDTVKAPSGIAKKGRVEGCLCQQVC